MNILIFGYGGREHALGWRLSQSPQVNKLYFAPGNSGTLQFGENLVIDFDNPDEMVRLAQEKNIELVIFGPFRYLKQGLSDVFVRAGIKVFGPSQSASEIEGSKIFSKTLMKEIGIPTSEYVVFYDFNSAAAYIKGARFPLVIKTDNPIPGIGVEIMHEVNSALKFLEEIFVEHQLGDNGAGVVIEEFLQGIEVSAHAFCDGTNAIMMPFAQDHKQLLEGDKGVNTSGMGTIVPFPSLPETFREDVRKKVVLPILQALREQGRPFVGVMYPGIMITENRWKVLEINARFGDPEAQGYMMLLESNLLEVMLACVNGKLSEQDVQWSKDYTCCLVLAVDGYPDNLITGKPIFGLPESSSKNDSAVVFHSETVLDKEQILTSGHRVVSVTSRAPTLQGAINNSYKVAEGVQFEGKYFRKDIGAEALRHV